MFIKHQGIARRLVKATMMEAARIGKKKYNEVKKIEKGSRSAVHDDTTVIVVFINHQTNVEIDEMSIRGFDNSTTLSSFSALQVS